MLQGLKLFLLNVNKELKAVEQRSVNMEWFTNPWVNIWVYTIKKINTSMNKYI